MKKWRLYNLIPLIIMTACSKNKIPTDLFEVIEYKTNTPIASVKIDLYKCIYPDIQFGCQGRGIFLFGMTDNNGKYSFAMSDVSKANEGIKLTRANYWEADGRPGKNYMSTEGWISLHLVRQNTYTLPRLTFFCEILGESYVNNMNSISIPSDTIIPIRVFGNQVNKLNWKIGSGFPFQVAASGTLSQSIERFGTTSATLSY